MKKIGLALFFFSSFCALFAQVETLKDCPVHEAFITQEYGNLNIQAVPVRPPQEIIEEIPNQDNPRLTWIPGYWSWSNTRGEYIWVSGTWRNPPSQHSWIPGYWKRFSEGWVWVRGFWSAKKEEALTYIKETPPDMIDENVPFPPNPQDAYFWVPGYWGFDFVGNKYMWFSGRWERLQDRIVYTPSRYMWREKGYVFIPGYWDWELENRGTAFSCVSIPENERTAAYVPSSVMQGIYVVETLFPQWPNYPCFFRCHFYFHNNVWAAWGAFPNWWDWSTWWCFTWQDTWWLWWWWAHSQYPAPSWMNANLAAKIAPPPELIVNMMKEVMPPPNVTANGVVGSKALINALQQLSGKETIILPSDPKQMRQIQQQAIQRQPTSYPLRPTGPRTVADAPKKPFFGPDINTLKTAPQRSVIPSYPDSPPSKASDDRIPSYRYETGDEDVFRNSPPRHLITPETNIPPQKPQPIRPQPTKKQSPRPIQSLQSFKPLEEIFFLAQGPAMEDMEGGYYLEPMQKYRMPPTYHSPFPVELNRQPTYPMGRDYPYHPMPYGHLETPMQLQHHDTISTHPLPQSNPPGPRVHQFPDDFSNEPLNK